MFFDLILGLLTAFSLGALLAFNNLLKSFRSFIKTASFTHKIRSISLQAGG